MGCSCRDVRVLPAGSQTGWLCGHRTGMLAGAALPPPAARCILQSHHTHAGTVPRRGPHRKARDKPQGHPCHHHPTGEELGRCPSARSPSPALPRPGEPKFSLAPARGETLPAPALISMARRPRGSRTPSWRCSVAASQGCTCVSHKHGGASRSRCGHGTRGSVGGIPGRQRAPEQHRLKIIIFLPDLTFT